MSDAQLCIDLGKARAEIERLRRERDEARDEKSRRIYFQDLAYHACNVADAVLGGTTVTGTVDTPDNDFKARLDGVKAEIERLQNTDTYRKCQQLIAERDEAREALRKYLAGDLNWLEVIERYPWAKLEGD